MRIGRPARLEHELNGGLADVEIEALADVLDVQRRYETRAQSGIATTASISTFAPRGSAATPIATRAGGSRSKND